MDIFGRQSVNFLAYRGVFPLLIALHIVTSVKYDGGHVVAGGDVEAHRPTIGAYVFMPGEWKGLRAKNNKSITSDVTKSTEWFDENLPVLANCDCQNTQP